VIVNEFGEIGIDDALVVSSSDQVILLASGCLCCTSRGDLVDTLGDLMGKRERGEIPPFMRVVVETTGLADPAPILQGLMTDLMLLNHFRMGHVVTVVDCYHGAKTLDQHIEAVKQAAVADCIVLSKGDIAAPGAVAELRTRLRRLNPVASIIEAVMGEVEPTLLFGSTGFDIAEKTAEVRSWLAVEAPAHGHDEHGHGHDPNRHDERIRAHCLTFAAPLDWESVAGWLDQLANEHGENLLRVKGLLNVSGQDEPVVIQGVHHLFHPPSTLPAWPDADRRSRLVFIVRDLDRAAIEAGAPDTV
jgi:G3E family GTPase